MKIDILGPLSMRFVEFKETSSGYTFVKEQGTCSFSCPGSAYENDMILQLDRMAVKVMMHIECGA